MQHFSLCTLLLLSLYGASAKYAYIKEAKTWSEAQQQCQEEYAGLAPISNKQDIVRMMMLADRNYPLTWTEMMRSDREMEKWMFWGGGRISGFFPASESGSAPGYFPDIFQTKAPFFCFRPVVVMEKKSWEEAWRHCRKHHNMLASVASEEEMKLIQRELSKYPTTERIWVGLHFFPGDGWLWVDSQPLEYKSWGSGGMPQCPKVNMECAALKVSRLNTISSGLGINPLEDVWDAHDCGEKLHFICY